MSSHKTSKILKIDPDSALLIYSFLPLKDILILFEHDKLRRNKVLNIAKPELPSILDAVMSNNLLLVKYLFELNPTQFTTPIDLKEIGYLINRNENPEKFPPPISAEELDDIYRLYYSGDLEPLINYMSIFVSKYTDINMSTYFGIRAILQRYENPNNEENTIYSDVINILDLAVFFSRYKIVDFLVDNNIKPTTLTMNFAVVFNDLNMVKYLLQKGVVITTGTIHTATHFKRYDIIKYLEENTTIVQDDNYNFDS